MEQPGPGEKKKKRNKKEEYVFIPLVIDMFLLQVCYILAKWRCLFRCKLNRGICVASAFSKLLLFYIISLLFFLFDEKLISVLVASEVRCMFLGVYFGG